MEALQKPVDRTLTDQVARNIRKSIIIGDLPPGTRLTELQLAEHLKVSRSTIREAFRRLEAEALIDVSPYRGTRVASIDENDALEICELHALLESDIVEYLALPIDDELSATLLGHVDAMASLTFPSDIDQFIDIDRQFHRSIVVAAQRRRFLQVWQNLNSLLGLLVAVNVRRLSIDAHETATRHRAIVDALRQEDREIATRVIREHYQLMGSGPERRPDPSRRIGRVPGMEGTTNG